MMQIKSLIRSDTTEQYPSVLIEQNANPDPKPPTNMESNIQRAVKVDRKDADGLIQSYNASHCRRPRCLA